MAIRKRAVVATTESKGKHPMLKSGLTYTDVFNYIALHPGCTREDIINNTPLKSSAITGRVADLKAQGLIVEDGWSVGTSGRRVHRLWVDKKSVTGNPRDKLCVVLQVFCNDCGEYYLKARLKNQVLGAETRIGTLCLKKDIVLTVTPPSKLGQFANVCKNDLLIDAEYEIVDNNK